MVMAEVLFHTGAPEFVVQKVVLNELDGRCCSYFTHNQFLCMHITHIIADFFIQNAFLFSINFYILDRLATKLSKEIRYFTILNDNPQPHLLGILTVSVKRKNTRHIHS